jgi:hypothetical protein
MATWPLDHPDKLTFDEVHQVLVKTVEGAVSIVGSDDRPTLELSELSGEPLRVQHEGGTLTVDYERPWRPWPIAWLTGGGSQRRKAVLTLAVPRDCRVELRVVSASLMVGGLHAPVEAHTVSGEITLTGLRGRVEAESVSGPVQASSVTGDLSARTVSGDLTVAEGGGSVRAGTVSGAVAIDLQARGDRDISLSSVSGDLTVRLPETSDLQVKLQSTSGDVTSAFDQLEHDRTPGRYTAWGRLGAGTGRLRAASTSGHVALLRRAPEAGL